MQINALLSTGRPLALLLSLAALLLTTVSLRAQPQHDGPPPFLRADDPRVENRSYFFAAADEQMPYSLFVSSKVDDRKKNPLIVALHGLGVGAGFMLRGELLDMAERGGYIVVGPMGYNAGGWYGSPIINMRRDQPVKPSNLRELSEQDVLNVLALVRDEFNIDENRIYLLGHSMGGAGTLYLGAKHSGNWAAIAAIAPAAFLMQPEEILAAVKHSMPVLIVQGGKDKLVPPESTRRWVNYMQQNNMDHRYVYLPEADHGSVIEEAIAPAFAWFAEHSGKVTP